MRTASNPVPSVENQSAKASVTPAWNSSSRGCSGRMIENSAMPLAIASNTSSALGEVAPNHHHAALRRRMDRANAAQEVDAIAIAGHDPPRMRATCRPADRASANCSDAATVLSYTDTA